MELLKLRLKVPFWCSFTEYGTLKLKQTYPFPPPPTIFGMILNAMGKPSTHNEKMSENKIKKYKEWLNKKYNKLSFSISVKDEGILVEDYRNILKGIRKRDRNRRIENKLSKLSSDMDEEEFDEIVNNLRKSDMTLNELENKIGHQAAEIMLNFSEYINNEKWQRTQVKKQKLLSPIFDVYLSSADKNSFSLKNIYNSLKNPERPLYLGGSDDIVDLRVEKISSKELDKHCSSNDISSIIPGLYENCNIYKIPVQLRHQKEKSKMLCSFPQGKLQKEIRCVSVKGEDIVFLQDFS